jgi:protein disulfide-isomerase
MKRLLTIAFLFLFTLPAMAQHSDGLEWHTDLMKANELAKVSGKPIFGFFTGSDWCGWCHKLQRDVFAKPEFVKWAKANVILLELDFPRGKQLPQETVQQNQSLQQAFQVQGFPTIWYFSMSPGNGNGQMAITAYGNQGYPSGATPGKEEVTFLNMANDILAKAKTEMAKNGATAAPAATDKPSATTAKAKTKTATTKKK